MLDFKSESEDRMLDFLEVIKQAAEEGDRLMLSIGAAMTDEGPMVIWSTEEESGMYCLLPKEARNIASGFEKSLPSLSGTEGAVTAKMIMRLRSAAEQAEQGLKH
jgi:hypothetical protein